MRRFLPGFGTSSPVPARPARVVVVGGGFGGFNALQRLTKLLGPDRAVLTLVAPTDYLLYSPLLPEVATGVLDPRDIAVSTRQALPRVKLVLGHVTTVDFDARELTVIGPDGDSTLEWDKLILAPGSVTKQFDIPGVDEHAYGLKTLSEAVYIRNHVLAQLDAADALPDTPEGRSERAERLTVVAVGAGYTGTEFVAQMQNWVKGIASRWASVDPDEVRWVLVDVADAVLPELGARLGKEALAVLAERGVDVRLGVSVASATATSVTLTDDEVIPSRTLVWGAGVAASPLIARLGLPTAGGRLVVGADMTVPGVEDVWAIGDAAAVPDLAADPSKPTPPTAQHAQRQGVAVARNVAASLGVGQARPYKHTDLGLVADLGGFDGVAKPLGIPLTGPVAKFVARGYHLYALPTVSARVRVATDWLYSSVLPTRVVNLAQVRSEDALIKKAQAIDLYDRT
ncbi:pyridine nucleotide-disulfide oxidoreductase [Rhodococcus sp. 05-2254-6]|uniref:NAD(P)/FAD-dependent oxidoreductase n=1 Tax=Rhodococcus sp. 05-2254-6 TaxID=2022489 RepID=UPI000B9BD170|nr:NAD(P)/FAD-dependent oxidoreductase [Rhodococcus sp. 05-2254-6]OZE39633.1 pyridine nucleotide-disulfide oxidoreductase [Rhodococcus sp. 05-2254-6]